MSNGVPTEAELLAEIEAELGDMSDEDIAAANEEIVRKEAATKAAQALNQKKARMRRDAIKRMAAERGLAVTV